MKRQKIMGSAESCCGRNEKTKSSSVDRSRGDVKKRNEDRPIENVEENAEKKNLSQKKKHSVHEGTGPPPGITSTDDITMQESDAEPKQMKPPGRTYALSQIDLFRSLTYQPHIKQYTKYTPVNI